MLKHASSHSIAKKKIKSGARDNCRNFLGIVKPRNEGPIWFYRKTARINYRNPLTTRDYDSLTASS